MPLPRWSVPSPTRQTTAVKSLQPAAELVKELAEQAEQHLRQAARRLGQGS